MRPLIHFLLIAVTFNLLYANQIQAGKIEAIEGKKYFLTKKHGPWMIMVAVFSEPPEEMKAEGMGPEEAAEALVLELRRKGIPAYTFWRDERRESIQTINRKRQKERRTYLLDKEICVLAGNYNSPEEKNQLAKRTLEWIKKYDPQCLKGDGIYKPTPGQPGVLSGAFLTINPMLSPEEAMKRKRDPDVIRFNSHYRYSLLDNPGKYTVVVASFYGNSITQVAGQTGLNADKKLGSGFGLAVAADKAWQVMRTLREKENMEAYVFHDRKQSIVTVGSFDSKDDPRIRQIYEKFAAKRKLDPKTGKPVFDPQTGKAIYLPSSYILPSHEGQWMCTFDPIPKVIEVPYKD